MENELDGQQMDALRRILHGDSVAILGAAGTGKTTIVRAAYAELMRRNGQDVRRVVLTASTGVAACQYAHGQTINQWAMGWVWQPGERANGWRRMPSYAKRQWALKLARTLFLDEISMISSVYLDELDAMCQDARGNSLPFGGLQVVVIGDFFQLPPCEASAKYAFMSKVWQDVFDANSVFLETEHRQAGDDGFRQLLRRMRTGEMCSADYAMLESRVDSGVNGVPHDRVHLYGYRKDAAAYNEMRMSMLEGVGRPFQARFTLKPAGAKHATDADDTPAARLKFKHILCPLEQVLKVGMQVMLVANVDLAQGLCNGTMGTLVRFGADSGDPVVLVGDVEHTIAVWEYHVTLADKSVLSCHVVPLVAGWALTVHKSQSKQWSLVYVGGGMWSNGSFYTAVTRAKTLAGVLLAGFRRDDVKMDPIVRRFYACGRHYEL